MLLFALAFPVPLLIAVFHGYRGGRSDPQTIREFAIRAGFEVAWSTVLIFLYHALWIATIVPAHWHDTARSALSWTLGTGAIWLPLLMITFVLRAMKARREA